VPVISDRWAGLDSIFAIGEEILVADSAAEVTAFLTEVDEDERRAIAAAARRRVLAEHTAARRCDQLEHEVAGVAAR
jgi:spore maturation protein CgeB